MDDINNNTEALKAAIAAALGIPPEEVDLTKIVKTVDGIKIEITHLADTDTDAKDFAKKLTEELKTKNGFENVNVSSNQLF